MRRRARVALDSTSPPRRRPYFQSTYATCVQAFLAHHDGLRHGKNASACPFNRWNCTAVPRHAQFAISKAATSS
jgi:hypothetical protein